jgi:hypothetical protein
MPEGTLKGVLGYWVGNPPFEASPMRILPALLAGLASSTAFASGAFAGPSLTGINSTRIQGTAQFNTSFGESFSVDGITDAAVTPFAASTGLMMDPAAPTNVGNVGTAVLAVTFLEGGTGIAGSTGPQVQSTSGIIQLGGSSTIGGMMLFDTPSALILDQTSVSGISIGAGENIGATITGTQVGTSSLNADVTIVNQVINNLTAF